MPCCKDVYYVVKLRILRRRFDMLWSYVFFDKRRCFLMDFML